MKFLTKMTLSQVGLDREGLRPLAAAITTLPCLMHLDISSNLLDAISLSQFFATIAGHNKLKSLNLSNNNAAYSQRHSHLEGKKDSFESNLSLFLGVSHTLLHLDISGTNLSLSQCEFIASKGLRQARSLQAVHMSGMDLDEAQIDVIRTALHCHLSLRKNAVLSQEALAQQVAVLNDSEVKSLFSTNSQAQKKVRASLVQAKAEMNANSRARVKQFIRGAQVQADESQKLLYQRVLGKNEMLFSHRWAENIENNCHLCCKMTYCVIIWNKFLALTKRHYDFFHFSDLEPITFTHDDYCEPVLAAEGRVHKMVPIREFYARLVDKDLNCNELRQTNNEIEKGRS